MVSLKLLIIRFKKNKKKYCFNNFVDFKVSMMVKILFMLDLLILVKYYKKMLI